MEVRSAGMEKNSLDTEKQTVTTNGNEGSVHLQVAADNINVMANRTGGTETDALLLEKKISSGEAAISVHSAEAQMNLDNPTPKATSCSQRIKKELNATVCDHPHVRRWMLLILIVILIAAVIILSLVICSVLHEDEDDEFDVSTFTVPRYFNGTFQLPNLVVTENPSNQTVIDLEGKLDDLFRSSPALGRYFHRAEINTLRSGPVIADYTLTFLIPEDEQDQLREFTLSREMVYNVFRQFLYDQDPDESGPMYIDPDSLTLQ
ncbi:TPA-induced transmembrane protein [Anabas testudineus]|uniref:SEA domain-containing protein n=1 Tax=Anabas testudineus TaxID=64144 RepID=A0A7N6BC87_ANATE|nr:TPA-induced transmembrane protein [Anabas testudineus]